MAPDIFIEETIDTAEHPTIDLLAISEYTAWLPPSRTCRHSRKPAVSNTANGSPSYFRAARGLDRNLFLKLAGCDFIRQHHNFC